VTVDEGGQAITARARREPPARARERTDGGCDGREDGWLAEREEDVAAEAARDRERRGRGAGEKRVGRGGRREVPEDVPDTERVEQDERIVLREAEETLGDVTRRGRREAAVAGRHGLAVEDRVVHAECDCLGAVPAVVDDAVGQARESAVGGRDLVAEGQALALTGRQAHLGRHGEDQEGADRGPAARCGCEALSVPEPGRKKASPVSSPPVRTVPWAPRSARYGQSVGAMAATIASGPSSMPARRRPARRVGAATSASAASAVMVRAK